jgi:hypothetical protein
MSVLGQNAPSPPFGTYVRFAADVGRTSVSASLLWLTRLQLSTRPSQPNQMPIFSHSMVQFPGLTPSCW